MHLEGSFETPAPRAVVWEFLLNPNDIAPCFPDLQSLEVLTPESFRAKVKVGLSVVRGTMDFDFKIAEKTSTSSAKLIGHGHGVGSTIEIQTAFTLSDAGVGTKVGWAADLNVGGIVAGLGSKLLDSQSNRMVTQVVENIQVKLNDRVRR
jgi:carbon monoxide dehydrogenase subunit G